MSSPPPVRPGASSCLVFSLRWLQLQRYRGPIVARGLYVFLFGKELMQVEAGNAKLA